MVARKCCVIGCKSRDSDWSLSFYSIPKVGRKFSNSETIELYSWRREEWLKILRLEEDKVTKNSFVCSLHFVNGELCCVIDNCTLHLTLHHSRKSDYKCPT